jgi:hypothetical protein
MCADSKTSSGNSAGDLNSTTPPPPLPSFMFDLPRLRFLIGVFLLFTSLVKSFTVLHNDKC